MIEIDVLGGVTRLTLNRPDKANALTSGMLSDLVAAVQGANSPVLVVTGVGRVFSAGADLEEVRAGLAISPLWEDLSHAIATYPGLTIAALNGTAAGGSLGMVLACDLRIAAPGAKVFYPVMRLGVLPQPSDVQRCRALAPSLARRLFLTGEKIAVEQAAGLIDRLADDPMTAALDMAADALSADPEHVVAIKSMVQG